MFRLIKFSRGRMPNPHCLAGRRPGCVGKINQGIRISSESISGSAWLSASYPLPSWLAPCLLRVARLRSLPSSQLRKHSDLTEMHAFTARSPSGYVADTASAPAKPRSWLQPRVAVTSWGRPTFEILKLFHLLLSRTHSRTHPPSRRIRATATSRQAWHVRTAQSISRQLAGSTVTAHLNFPPPRTLAATRRTHSTTNNIGFDRPLRSSRT